MRFIETRYLFKKGRVIDGELVDMSNLGVSYSDLYSSPLAEKALTDFFQPKTAWENWLFLTHDCNLDCAYCFEDKQKTEIKWRINDLIKFFEWQSNTKDRKYFQENSKIIFYGGEPLLEQKLIEAVIKETKNLPFDFGLQTNGTLLDKVSSFILDNTDLISVSIDGSRETHDRNKYFKGGNGSYDLIINNLNSVKKRYDKRVLARITVPITPDYDFLKEIKSVIDTGLFTDYHWQLETPIQRKLTEKDIQLFLKNYVSSMKGVVNLWLSEMKNGNMLNIIPFETAVKSIISDELVVDLRANDPYTIRKEAKGICGCGDKLVVIDTDGMCYPCDTIVGHKDEIIGDIWKGVNPKNFIEKNEFMVYGMFKGCPRRVIKSDIQIAYTKETEGCPMVSNKKPDFYCQSAGGFIGEIKENMKDILTINPKGFFSPISEYTEQLP